MKVAGTAFRRALVTGARGMLGTEVAALLARRVETLPVDVEELDITDETAVAEVFRSFVPDVVFNCAAYTDVDGAESNRKAAFAVNAHGAGLMAEASAAVGARLLHVSTDYVFDGTKVEPYLEDDDTSPINVYGESKLAGEARIAAAGGTWLIARTAWLYGHGGGNFVETVLRLAAERDELDMVEDQIGSPTNARDLAGILIRLAEVGATGIVNATNAGRCSWYDLAREVLDATGAHGVRLNRVDSGAFPRPAARPAFSVLSLRRLTELLGETPRDWREAVRDYLAER